LERIFQLLIVFAVIWQWKPNPMVATLVGALVAGMVTPVLGAARCCSRWLVKSPYGINFSWQQSRRSRPMEIAFAA
jgi:hypothetical protein